MSRRTTVASFAIQKGERAPTGHGDLIGVSAISETSLEVSIRRSGQRPDGRGGRAIGIDLARREALALGRHLIAKAAGLSVAVDGEHSAIMAQVNVAEREGGLTSLRALTLGDDVMVSLDRILLGGGVQVEMARDISALLSRDEARSFARALLTMTGD